MMKMILANDIGNDKMKILEPGADKVTKIPSAYRMVLRKPSVHETDVNKNVANLLDQLFVHITSESIEYSGMYMVGERAIQSTEDVENMDIDMSEKHTDDLPLINTLAYVAARAVQKEFDTVGALPKKLEVEVLMSSAIPASQHTIETAKHLEDRFTEKDHLVIVYVGDKQVTVELDFTQVKVTKEGIPAIYSILEGPEDMFEEFLKEYPEFVGKDLQEVFAEAKMMHTDIGSGTTEYIYTIGPNPRPDVCTGARNGVGHASEEAIRMMAEDRAGLSINRQQFAKYIERPDEYPKDHQLAVKHLKMARIQQVKKIVGDIGKKYTKTLSSEPEFICVYGGGSIEFKPDMYKKVKDFADSVDAKLLWIPAKYAVNMNVKGLDVLNESIFFEEEYADVELV